LAFPIIPTSRERGEIMATFFPSDGFTADNAAEPGLA
jgi:hypothetical protein